MLKTCSHYLTRKISFLILVELAILLASAYLGLLFGYVEHGIRSTPQPLNLLLISVIFALTMVFAMGTLGMYQHDFSEHFKSTLWRLPPSFALGFGMLALMFYSLPQSLALRGIMWREMLIAYLGILLARILFSKSCSSARLASRMLFLGGGALANECRNLALRHVDYHQDDIVGCVVMPDEECQVPSSLLAPQGMTLAQLVERHKVNEIVVAVENRRSGNFPIAELLACKARGIMVTDAHTFFEREACQIRIDSLNPSWLVFGSGFDQSLLRMLIKRSFDLAVSLALFALTLPLMLITTLMIFIEDRGPIFYQQERVGKNGKRFNVLKFRSMRINAEQIGAPQFACANDPRITRIGRLLRKSRIDELPQILNVLNGDMSFVGPRPERPFFVSQFCQNVPYYDVRHSVKPGITGLAQVRYHYGDSAEDAVQKLQYDLFYVKNNDLFLDLLILFDTIQVVLFGKGSR